MQNKDVHSFAENQILSRQHEFVKGSISLLCEERDWVDHRKFWIIDIENYALIDFTSDGQRQFSDGNSTGIQMLRDRPWFNVGKQTSAQRCIPIVGSTLEILRQKNFQNQLLININSTSGLTENHQKSTLNQRWIACWGNIAIRGGRAAALLTCPNASHN